MSLLCGCMIGPDFKPPPARVGTNWIDSPASDIRTDTAEYRDWWAAFNDPVLDRLIDIAYRNNLTLRAAGVHVLAARAQLGVAIGEFYPQQQQIGGSLAYNGLPISTPYTFVNNTYWQDLLNAQASWEIDLWGKLRRAIESADDAYLASVADFDSALVTVVSEVARDYVQIRTLQAQIVIAQENADRQRESLRIAQARFEGGATTERDPDQAASALGATEAAIPALNIQLRQTKDALAVLLGTTPDQVDAVLTGQSAIPTAPRSVAVGIPADLLRRRPDVRRAELQAAAQCAQIGFAKADLLPAFTLTGTIATVGTNVSNGLGHLFTSDSLLYSTGPGFQWSLFNYGQITNNVRYQDAKFQELAVNYENAVLKANSEVQDGITAFVETHKEVEFYTGSVAASQDALRIATIQYQEGSTDFTSVLTAEQDLYQVQNSLAQSQGAVPLSLISIYRALGGGWQIREGGDFVPAQTRSEMSQRTNWGTLLTPDLLRPQAPGLPSAKDQGSLIRRPEP